MTAFRSPRFDLAAEQAWLRRFAATLVAPHDVDDLVQDTWVSTLCRTAVPEHLRSWMRGVMLHLALLRLRRRHRVDARERSTARDGVTSSTADVVASLEVRQAMGAAVLELPEPLREVLILRYHDNLPPRRIAELLHASPASVRQRLLRARLAVRERLQRRLGQDWRAGLVAWSLWPSIRGGALPIGFAVAALFTGMLVSTIAWVVAPRPSVTVMTPTLSASAAEPLVDPHGLAGRALAATSIAIERTAWESAAQDPEPTPPAFLIRGRLLDQATNLAVAGHAVAATIRWPKGARPAAFVDPKVASDDRGRFAIAWPRAAAEVSLWIQGEGYCTRWFEADVPSEVDLGDIPLTRGHTLRGRLVDEHEQPLADVRLVVRLAFGIRDQGRISFPTKTNARGEFEFSRVPAGTLDFGSETRSIRLIDEQMNFEPTVPTPIVLRGRSLPSIRGVVFTADGAPAAGVRIEALVPGDDPIRERAGSGESKADGSFEVFGDGTAAAMVELRTARLGAFEVVGDPIVAAWGSGGLRLSVRRLRPVRLQVVERDTGTPVERFAVQTRRLVGKAMTTSGINQRRHDDGVLEFPGLADGTTLLITPADPALCPVKVVVGPDLAAPTLVRVVRLHAVRIRLVDGNGRAVSLPVELVDPMGQARPSPAYDVGFDVGVAAAPTPRRLSRASTDSFGDGLLLAPQQGSVVIALMRNGTLHWLPLPPSPRPETVTLAVPD